MKISLLQSFIHPLSLLILFFVFIDFIPANAQSVYAPLNSDYYHLLERYEIRYGKFAEGFHSHIKPYTRKSIAQFADSISNNLTNLSQADKFNIEYLQNDNWEWTEQAQNDTRRPIFKVLYTKKSDFYQYRSKDFEVHINPVFYGNVAYEPNNENRLYANVRGLELRGMIAKKIGFYTYFTDSQANFPSYVVSEMNRLNAVPNEGYNKREIGGIRADFLTARGYIAFDIIKNAISLQFGYDKNFIGNGYRSMILSDYSSGQLFLKLNTKVWKLNYQNLFAQLTAEVLNSDGYNPKKYLAFHHLSLNVTKNFNIGIFESIIIGKQDSSSQSATFEPNYLNPIIFYRSVEQQLGSPDNANLGIDFRWNFLKHFSLYGQLFIDELKIAEIRAGKGWWGNKQSFQLGLKYIDVFGIRNLDLQAEVNVARPYTYTHKNNFTNYTNYNQPLAHPLGANFYEYIGILRYQPLNRLSFAGKIIYATYGTDDVNQNLGKNIFLDYGTRQQEYGNKTGQGIKTTLLFMDLTATWQMKHNLFLDFKQIIRRLDSELDTQDNTLFYSTLVLRWNIPQRFYEF